MTKTILITGASTGIGRATAIYFAARGWNVAATMRDPANAHTTLNHAQISLFGLDVTNKESIVRALEKIRARYQKIDVVLNNAGYGLFGPLEALSDEQIQRQFSTNVFGLINVIQEVLPSMRDARDGLISNVASIVGLFGFPYNAAYVATKHAVEGLSESLRYELSAFNVRVKIIEPGGINTDFGTRSMQIASSPPYKKSMDRLVSLLAKLNPRLPHPDTVAKVIFRAANDGSNRLRYLAKPGPFIILNRLLPDVLWRWILIKAMVK